MNSAQRRKLDRKYRYKIPFDKEFETNFEWEEATEAADVWCTKRFGREAWIREGWSVPMYKFKKAKHATLFGLMWS